MLEGVFSAFLNLLMLTKPIYMMQVFDRVLTTGHGGTLIALTVIVAAALAVLGVLEAVRLLLLSRTATWINASLGPKVLSASLARSLGNQPGGGQAMRDLGSLQGFLGSTSLNPFFDAPWTPVFVLFIFLLHPWLGVLARVSAIALFVIAVFERSHLTPSHFSRNRNADDRHGPKNLGVNLTPCRAYNPMVNSIHDCPHIPKLGYSPSSAVTSFHDIK